ncbi:unnamed protein product [Pedinophyceae sp. YPF-701]|nr:unnamed protein product [Pedinophyceae sp. YPF-701]
MGRSKELRRVRLESRGLDAGPVCAVFSALERSTLEVFDCTWSLDDWAGEGTCSALTESVASALRNNRTLRELALDFDSEDPDDLFLDVPKGLRLEDSYLRVLRLESWGVGDEGVREVMRSLRRMHRVVKLHTLEISNSEMTDEGAKHVAAALKDDTCTLRALSLTNTNGNEGCFGDEGAAAIADALRHNRSLVSLDLSNNNLTDRGQESLAAALADNTTLRNLDVWSCDGGSVRARDVLYAQRYAIGMRQMCARSTFRI